MISPDEDEIQQVASFLRAGVTRMLILADDNNATNATTASDFYQEAASGSSSGSEGYSDVAWMIMWFLSLAAFVFCPFCGSKRRRQLCMRRIRDRRWYQDDFDEVEETERQRRQRQEERARRRQQLHGHNEHFQVSKTQEDDIREQFLEVATENYSTVINNDDIFESDHQQVRSSSFRSNHGSIDQIRNQGEGTQQQNQKQSSTDKSPQHQEGNDDIEAPPSTNSEEADSSGDNSHDHDEEDAFMLVEDFQETNEVIRVPLPGQKHQPKQTTQSISNNESDDSDDDDEGKKKSSLTTTTPCSLSRRFAPNGCAICLSKYEDGEMITWSANPKCTHVFHKECVIHWFLAVGRKAQQRRQRNHPEMTDLEVLDSICKFPMLCPCCRQTFCYNPNDEKHRHHNKSKEKQHVVDVIADGTNATTTAPVLESIQPQPPEEQIVTSPSNDTEVTTTDDDEH